MKKKILLFNSYPDYSDNSYAIFKYLLENDYHLKYELIWLISTENPKLIHKKIYDEFSVKIKCYKKKSFLGVLNYFKADKIFFTHGLFSSIRVGADKKINLWHGMPLKNIGYLQKENSGIENFSCDFTIATCEIFQEIMMKSFGLEKNKVFLVGQPRNDLLFEKSNFYEKKKIKKENYNKVIIYLPTYRKSIIGDLREDGLYEREKLGIINLKELKILNENLVKNNNLMIIKLHPMDILQTLQLENFSNIIILKLSDLEEINEQLYPLLGSTDLLITDYSSVWVDYEILGKPIYFAIDDYSEYKKNRGFTIENLSEILPGEIIKNFNILLKRLDRIPQEIRKETGETFNKYKDNRSSERVLKELGLL